MDKLTVMRLFEQFEEFDEGDLTPEELEAYAAYCKGEEAPLSPRDWKENYFSYYDDVKDKSLKKQDW